ncbi:hypothetical protein C1Y63_10545 [Corynebacterium sp. 13CS0277]|uniref:phage portal protein family protein n=1 Tax=Corynebacterium sp. 13CS0277 TaxID=2071994 RepID=UPI000D02D2AB|nr:hypothetical protein [Corynebacterium sp. 13CS0277]PRQ10624.1 hypothetical protein C1Y63_10545 [Corynebacterium sp. 13CS0277]
MSELGYIADPGGFGPLQDDNWELRWPRSAWVYAKMGREDAQVQSILSALSLPIRRATWRVDPNGAPPEVVARVAEDLRLPVLGEEASRPLAPRQGRISWANHLQQALLSLQFGCMFFEQVYATDADGNEHLVKLAPRMPGTIQEVRTAPDGGLLSIVQRPAPNSKSAKPIEIPVSRLVAYVYNPVGGSWTGTSVLRPAYKHWKLRDQLLRLEVNALDRNGMGVPVYQGTEHAADRDADLATGRELASQLRAGAATGAAIPAGAKLEIKAPSGTILSPRAAIEYHDAQMARAVLAHFLNLSDGGGSYALAETQADLFIQALQTIAEWVADTATQHIVEDLVQVAFPEHTGTCPQIMCDPIASKKELTASDLSLLVNAGAIWCEPALEDDLRRRYNLPPKSPDFQPKIHQSDERSE